MPSFRNLVFKGGGVRGIAYLGALEYLYENGLMRSVERTAGTSAGAITATVVALNFGSFEPIKAISDSLDYRKVPSEGDLAADHTKLLKAKALALKTQSLGIFKSFQCSVRLVQEKGWYSSEYFYKWLKSIIAGNFTVEKEIYTFRDFRNASIHAEKRPFFDLYITGTDISNRTSKIFSHETTPDMEVALAVRISMSIPIFLNRCPSSIRERHSRSSTPTGASCGTSLSAYLTIRNTVKNSTKGSTPKPWGFSCMLPPMRQTIRK